MLDWQVGRRIDTSDIIWLTSSATPIAQHQLDHCYGACTGFQSCSGLISNSPNFVIWWPLFNSQATLQIWLAHTVSLVRCGRPHRSFCQFRRTTWTLLLVVSLLLLQDSETLFLRTVELLHLLTHLRPGLRHFSFRHNPHCSTRLCTMARYKCIDWWIDWLFRWQLKGHLTENHGHGDLWLLICSTLEKLLTYLLNIWMDCWMNLCDAFKCVLTFPCLAAD